MKPLSNCLVVLLLIGATAAAEPPKPPLGMNLAGVTDWSSELVFVDAFQSARGWISQAKGQPFGQGGPLDLDDQGHLRSLKEGQFAETVLWTGFEKTYPAGAFVCLFDGDGDIDFTFDAKATKREPGRMEIEVKPKDGQAFLRITRTDPKNPIRNIRVILPGFEKTYKEEPFHPDFLKRWQGFKVFRFMDWQRTNNSKLVEWADRPTPRSHSQALKGVALETMIDLCNRLDVAPWFCMPHRASDDFVRLFARMTKEKLKPSLRVHVEYSNECWNGQFEQARYCAEQGKKLELGTNAYEAQMRYFSRRSLEIFKLWEEEFAKERLVRVLASQSANPWTGTTVMDWQDAFKSSDAIAVAPYFGHRWGSPKNVDETLKLSADELIEKMSDDVAESRKHITTYATEAKKRGLRLMAYEGGQHVVGHGGAENNDKLTQLFHAVNRHPKMKALYLQNLSDWREAGGDLFCVFSSVGRYSKWGSWGVLEYAAQDPSQAPKFQALREYLDR